MLTPYERRLIVSYLLNAHARLDRNREPGVELARWVAVKGDVLGLADRTGKSGEQWQKTAAEEAWRSAKRWRALQDVLEGARASMERVRADRTAMRLRRFAREMHLSRMDLALLEILLRYRTQSLVESLADSIFSNTMPFPRWGPLFNVMSRALTCLLGVSPGGVAARFAPEAPLVRSGLVSVDRDGDFELIGRLDRLAHSSADAGMNVHHLLLDPARPSELEWTDFDHIAQDRDHVERLLRGALDRDAAGVNVLIHGPPGTGKTEFCKVLARRLGVTLYSVGEVDENGDEPRRGERLAELRLAQRLLSGGQESMLLFDEMDDLLSASGGGYWTPFMARGSGRFRADGSKVFMNRLLEQAPTPTLWTSNTAGQTCPTVLRRMMFALELRQPSARVRARIWVRQLQRHGIELGEEAARALAAEYDVAPGVAAGASAAAALVDGGLPAVRRGVRSLCRVLSAHRPPRADSAQEFDPALLRANIDLSSLAERLAQSRAQRFSLCLQGPPGTGKSAFVRYLAERVGLEVVQKRASDLLSKWVGDTEQRIAAAFAEAHDAGHFLVFDEADSLLADRRFAERTWEVSQVNEMLAWMEHHPLPFACTTNFGERLDPAALRRFDFKVALDYLAPGQARAAFLSWFGVPPPAEVAALRALTPGDFAVVHRQACILGRLDDPAVLAAMLHAECEAKPNCPRPMGFLGEAVR